MPQIDICRNKQGRLILYSLTEGFRVPRLPCTRIHDDTVLQKALWLERHGFVEEAEELLETWVTNPNYIVRMVREQEFSRKG